jgi:hypothetical protein
MQAGNFAVGDVHCPSGDPSMSHAPDAVLNRRQCERFRLPAMYTSVSATPVAAQATPNFQGHAYDVSESGIRIELDEPLDPGQTVDLRLDLPGGAAEVSARADVVWVNEQEDDPGPRRMALRFIKFKTGDDRARLLRYLGSSPTRVAA